MPNSKNVHWNGLRIKARGKTRTTCISVPLKTIHALERASNVPVLFIEHKFQVTADRLVDTVRQNLSKEVLSEVKRQLGVASL